MGKVDKEALKRSKKEKSKIGNRDIVLKSSLCPATDEACKKGCREDQCKKLAP